MRHHPACWVAAVLATVAGSVAAPPALAAGRTTTAPTPAPATPATIPTAPTTPTTPTPAMPVNAAARLYLPGVFVVGHQAATVPGRTVQVSGFVAPYVADQWVTVRSYLGRSLIKSDRLRIKPSRNGRLGRFTERVRSPRAGLLIVRATHERTPQMLGFLTQRGVAELSQNVGFGARGRFVQLLQQRLAGLHFYLPQTGVYDEQTGLAIDAYHRLLGRGTSQSPDGVMVSDLLNGVGTFKLRDPRAGKHVEANLSNQLLALIYGAKVFRIYPISSGKPSTPTVLGHFHVYLRDPGYLPDGMYYSDFFYGGYAIHGYNPAPDYPASHGCLRLPIIDAISVFNWLNYGDAVDVYN